VSEYQYFEFRAIDRPLDERAQRELRGISSRASITATSFTNTYSWGNLKADPVKMLAQWFDVFLYVTNWGTRWLAFRAPIGSIEEEALAPWEGELFSSRREGEYLCLHFLLEDDDGGEWIDGEEWLGSLLPLREAIGSGDFRCLYLAWLADVGRGFFGDEDDDEEPPVPPGLGNLDAAHQAFVEFMGIDTDLVAVAAEASAPLVPTEASSATARTWLAALDIEQKDEWLVRVLEGEGARIRWELAARLRDERRDGPPAGQEPRTVDVLVERASELAEERLRRKQLERSERRRRQAERRATARQQHLDGLTGRELELWKQVDELIATLKPNAYDQAVALLNDLGDLAERSGDRAAWAERTVALRAAHARKSSLLRRLDAAIKTPGSEEPEAGSGEPSLPLRWPPAR